ncbi:MAG: ABC transporter ATP-binding protein [Thiomicrospira sp.]|nr:ABC transporter ATP-binding protein [Thiomicrospira sp.]
MLKISDIQVVYNQTPVLDRFNLDISAGEIVGILGPSGCGKSTLLRAIAGFVDIAKGEICLNNDCLASCQCTVPPEKRGVGMVFQDNALFPHLSVAQNIGFGLNKLNKVERNARVAELIELIQLQGMHDRYPHELSGGQQQRVALARALAPRPSLILFDEPFSNLDTTLSEHLAVEIRQLLKQQNTAAILVTHTFREAQLMCDRYGTLESCLLGEWQQAA